MSEEDAPEIDMMNQKHPHEVTAAMKSQVEGQTVGTPNFARYSSRQAVSNSMVSLSW